MQASRRRPTQHSCQVTVRSRAQPATGNGAATCNRRHRRPVPRGPAAVKEVTSNSCARLRSVAGAACNRHNGAVRIRRYLQPE
jgi:hypothetical protein